MAQFLHTIYHWFEKNKRDLPWRRTNDPYKIWISEIILQQTQVKQGIEYYSRFISRFPDIFKLARSPEDEVLKMWQGLGYYSRARNLHHSAKIIVNNYNGQFPSDYEKIISLKGIGEYTAAAIASITFNLPYAAVDGNVSRFLARYFNYEIPVDTSEGKSGINKIANEILDKANPGMHNQAVMEFGALQCTSINPSCTECPVGGSCLAFHNDLVRELPLKTKRPKQKNRYFNYFLFESGNKILMQKREGNDIWKNLWQLPLIETESDTEIGELLQWPSFSGFTGRDNIGLVKVEKRVIHILSHQKIIARFIRINISEFKNLPSEIIPVNKKDIHKLAVPKLIENFLTESGIIN